MRVGGVTDHLDPRLNAYRGDLADSRLRERIVAERYVEGQPARVVVGRAPVRLAADPAAETVTFYHYGELVLVFDEAAGFAWCQSRFDGYVGYVEVRQIALGAGPSVTHFAASSSGCYVYDRPDVRAAPRDFLPRHSAVVVAEAGRVTRGTEYARLDTGGYLPLSCLGRSPPRSPDLVAAAALYLGCPYLWGGRSFLGIDCSGLVQSAFRDLGITVLRDTDMQRDAIGEPVVLDSMGGLLKGDLLYMPGHVLIYAGDGAVIHADGVTMTVRRQEVAEFMRARGLELSAFVVRRHPAASGSRAA